MSDDFKRGGAENGASLILASQYTSPYIDIKIIYYFDIFLYIHGIATIFEFVIQMSDLEDITLHFAVHNTHKVTPLQSF